MPHRNLWLKLITFPLLRLRLHPCGLLTRHLRVFWMLFSLPPRGFRTFTPTPTSYQHLSTTVLNSPRLSVRFASTTLEIVISYPFLGEADGTNQKMENFGPWAKLSLTSFFVNKVLLKHNYNGPWPMWPVSLVPSGMHTRGNWSMFLSHIDISLPLFLPPFPSLKIKSL